MDKQYLGIIKFTYHLLKHKNRPKSTLQSIICKKRFWCVHGRQTLLRVATQPELNVFRRLDEVQATTQMSLCMFNLDRVRTGY